MIGRDASRATVIRQLIRKHGASQALGDIDIPLFPLIDSIDSIDLFLQYLSCLYPLKTHPRAILQQRAISFAGERRGTSPLTLKPVQRCPPPAPSPRIESNLSRPISHSAARATTTGRRGYERERGERERERERFACSGVVFTLVESSSKLRRVYDGVSMREINAVR